MLVYIIPKYCILYRVLNFATLPEIQTLEQEKKILEQKITDYHKHKTKRIEIFLSASDKIERWQVNTILDILNDYKDLKHEKFKQLSKFCYENRKTLPQDARKKAVEFYVNTMTAENSITIIEDELQTFSLYSPENKRIFEDMLSARKNFQPKRIKMN